MPERLKNSWPGLIVFTISLGAFMGSLDVTIVNIALPTIAEAFSLSTGIVSWVSLSYLIVLTGFMIAFGRLADIRGYKKIFVLGFAVFTVGSLLCGLVPHFSDNFSLLIIFRVVQALGASVLGALASGMVAAYLSPENRGRGLAFITVMASLGIAAGPFIGGLLTQYLGWNWIFLVNVPVGAAAVVLSLKYLPPDGEVRTGAAFDTPGAVLIFLVLLTGIFAVNRGVDYGWTSAAILFSVAACAISAAAFILHESRHPDPLVDLSLFKNPAFSSANIAGSLVMLVFMGAMFILPFFLEMVTGFTVSMAGVILVAPSVAMIFGGPAGGVVSDRRGSRGVCVFSASLAAVSFAMFSSMNESSPLWFILAALAFMGFSAGMFIPANSRLIFSHTPPSATGTVSALMMAARDAGASIGVAVFEAVFAAAVYSMVPLTALSGAAGSIETGILESGFRYSFLAGLLFCLACVFFSVFSRDPE